MLFNNRSGHIPVLHGFKFEGRPKVLDGNVDNFVDIVKGGFLIQSKAFTLIFTRAIDSE